MCGPAQHSVCMAKWLNDARTICQNNARTRCIILFAVSQTPQSLFRRSISVGIDTPPIDRSFPFPPSTGPRPHSRVPLPLPHRLWEFPQKPLFQHTTYRIQLVVSHPPIRAIRAGSLEVHQAPMPTRGVGISLSCPRMISYLDDPPRRVVPEEVLYFFQVRGRKHAMTPAGEVPVHYFAECALKLNTSLVSNSINHCSMWETLTPENARTGTDEDAPDHRPSCLRKFCTSSTLEEGSTVQFHRSTKMKR